MEETYLEIIRKHFNSFDRMTDEEPAAKELADLNREFIEWIGSKELFFDKDDNTWIFEIDEVGVVSRKTSDELFNFWIKEVRTK